MRLPTTPESILDQVPGAILAIDRDARITLSNRGLESMFGYGRGEIRGRAVSDLLPAGLASVAGDTSRRSIGRHAQGHDFAIDVAVGPAEGFGDAVVLALIHDAAAREAAEDRNRLDDQILSVLVDGIVDYAVFMLDLEGKVVTWNQGARAIKGYEARDIIGRNFSTFFTPEDRASGLPDAILEIAGRTGRFEAEGWRVRKDGTRFLAHVTLGAIRDAQGLTTAFAKITRDVTERRRQEDLAREAAALAQSLELQRRLGAANEMAARSHQRLAETLNAVIAASPLGLCTINIDGVYEIWNPFCERLFGYAASEIIGRKHDVVAALTMIEGETVLDAFWPPRAPQHHGEWEVRRRNRDGTILTLRISYAPIRAADGDLIGHVYIINDLTERRLIEQQLQQAQKMEAIGQLTGGIAHDFNNLLSIMIVNLEFVIEDAEPGSDILESSQAALAAALRGAELIQRMLSFARKQQLETTTIDVNSVVRDMTMLLRRSLGEHIDIAFRPSEALWPARADPSQLQNALANLATNARDAMGAGGSLSLETANTVLDKAYLEAFPDVAQGDYVVISVSDTGKGMAPDIVARAFDPFFTTKPEGQGTGLGLSMVFGFAKQSSGHVRLYSEPGLGTTVKIFLPRAADGAPLKTSPPTRPPRDRTGMILIVEDNDSLAKAVERMLQRAGYMTMVAHDAPSALAIVAGDAPIDLMFTDVVLGSGMSGIELAATAAAEHPDLKILFTSGFAENVLTGVGRTTVADRLLSKPYEPGQLLDKISSALDSGDQSAMPVKSPPASAPP